MPAPINEGERTIIIIKCVAAMLCFWYGFIGVFICIWKSNYNAAITSLLLETVSVQLLRYNAYYLRGTLQDKTSATSLRILKIFSLVIFILLVASAIGDFYLGFSNKQGFHIEQDGYYYAAIPAVLGAIMSILLFLDTIKFQAYFDTPQIYLQAM